jgi:glycosyltransferase involved in cell wall biosynthesis
VLVAPHNFEIGGSQINALELASELSRRPEYEVEIYAPTGELKERALAMGVEVHLSELRERAPSLRRIRELASLLRRRRFDLLHVYEWAPTIDATYAQALGRGVPTVSTILSMDYPYFLPKQFPTILGTRELTAQALAEGRDAHLLEPPVDTKEFVAGSVSEHEIQAVRQECGAGPDDILIVVIGRLAALLKLDGLLALTAAVASLADAYPIKLAIVGDGPARDAVESAAERANGAAGREVVRLLGARSAPRPYYAAADIVVGMGSSALRALSMSRPLLVQGESAFWAVADHANTPQFLEQGWYGIGDGIESVERCATELRRLAVMSPDERELLGEAGRKTVEAYYSLESAGSVLGGYYLQALARPRPRWTARAKDAVLLSLEMTKYAVARGLPWLQRAFRRLTRR